MKRTMSWRSLKFIPDGGDESHAITQKDEGFMHLCEVFRYHPERFTGYAIHDTKGMFAKYGHNNVDVRWSDFRQALVKYSMEGQPKEPTVFCGEPFSYELAGHMRKRLLATALREYGGPEYFAQDLLKLMLRGRKDDIRKFVIHLLFGLGWLEKPPRTAEAASQMPIDPPEGQVLLTT